MQVLLPIIKRIIPSQIAEEMCNVQSMQAASSNLFKIRTPFRPFAINGSQFRRHDFFYGWQRMYADEWISEAVWWKLKIKGF